MTLRIEDQNFIRKSRSFIRDLEPSGFNNLPVKLLLKIFYYFSEVELRKYVIPVCQKWRQVALLPENWKFLSFKGKIIPKNYMYQELRKSPFLKSIYLENISNAPAVIRQISRCNYKDLVSITIKNCSGYHMNGRLHEFVLLNLIISCRNIQRINLKGTQFYAKNFFVEIGSLDKLKSINISQNNYLQTKNLFELVLNCSSLEELKFNFRNQNQNLNDNDVMFLFEHLKKSLKKLSFDTLHFSDSAFKAILECSKLNKLNLYNATHISSETFNNIWKKIPNLKELKVHNAGLASQDYETLFTNGVSVMSNLVILDLAGNKELTDNSLEKISNCCPLLKTVGLRGCTNLKRIDSLMENCKMIKLLNIAFCSSLENDLLELPSQMHNLKNLYYHQNEILYTFKENWPHISIMLCFNDCSNMSEIF